MVDQSLLTTYVVVTALAVLIQTGIVMGIYVTTLKMAKKADLAVAEAQKMVEPAHRMVHALEAVSTNVAMHAASSVSNLRRLESQVGRSLDRLRQKIA